MGYEGSIEMNWMPHIRYPTHCWVLLLHDLIPKPSQPQPLLLVSFCAELAQRKEGSALALKRLDFVRGLRNLKKAGEFNLEEKWATKSIG